MSVYLQYNTSVKLLEKIYSLKEKYGSLLGVQLLSYDLDSNVLRALDQQGTDPKFEQYPERRYRTLMMSKNVLQGLKKYSNYILSTGPVHGFHIDNIVTEHAEVNAYHVNSCIIDASGMTSPESLSAIKEYWNERMQELRDSLIELGCLNYKARVKWPEPYLSLLQNRAGLYRNRQSLSPNDKEVIIEELDKKVFLPKQEKESFIRIGLAQYTGRIMKFWSNRVRCGSIGHGGEHTDTCVNNLKAGVLSALNSDPTKGI